MGGRSGWLPRLARTAVCCALAAVAWVLAQGASPEADADQRAAAPANAAPANQTPVLALSSVRVSVRAGERASVSIEALDPDLGEDGVSEAVWLGAALRPDPLAPPPAWLTEAVWSAGPSERPRLELWFRPSVEAAPGSFTIEAGATDARGLSALANVEVTVLPPRCGPREVDEGGICVPCPENRLPDGTRTFCEPCPAGTERPADATACAACPMGMASAAGESCGCGQGVRLADGVCVDCPPHTESVGDACVSCPAGAERPAGLQSCIACRTGETSAGGVACTPKRIASKAAAAPAGATAKSSSAVDTTAPTIVAADYAGRTMTLTLSEPVWVEEAADPSNFVVRSNVVYRVRSVAVASRQDDASDVITLTLTTAVTGSAAVLVSFVGNRTASRRPRDAAGNRMGFSTVTALPRRTLTVSFDGSAVAESSGDVDVTLALDNPPETGSYSSCGLRLAAGSIADAADVEFINANQALNPGNGWQASAKLLRVTDDGLAEGDEGLAVEAHCAGGAAGMTPPPSGLAFEPAALAITDNESRTILLAALPAAIRETAGATPVTVTATLDGQATEQLELPLTLSGTATVDDYRVAGTQRIEIGAGATSGLTVLTVSPTADQDDADETIAIGSTLAGYAVTGADVAITEPAPPPTLVATATSARFREDVGTVIVRLTLKNPPEAGGYTGCRLRLAAGSEAETPADVAFPNRKRLTADNGWTTQGKLLRVVDDRLTERSEALVVEGHCTGREPGTEPASRDLVSEPLRLTIKDNDQVRPLTLSVVPATIGETLGEQTVEVTASVADAPPSPVTVSLDLGSGAYKATGSLSVTIPAGATSGATTLAFTPAADGNASDDAVAIGGVATGYTVTGASLTIAEPTTVGGVGPERPCGPLDPESDGDPGRVQRRPPAGREAGRRGRADGGRVDGAQHRRHGHAGFFARLPADRRRGLEEADGQGERCASRGIEPVHGRGLCGQRRRGRGDGDVHRHPGDLGHDRSDAQATGRGDAAHHRGLGDAGGAPRIERGAVPRQRDPRPGRELERGARHAAGGGLRGAPSGGDRPAFRLDRSGAAARPDHRGHGAQRRNPLRDQGLREKRGGRRSGVGQRLRVHGGRRLPDGGALGGHGDGSEALLVGPEPVLAGAGLHRNGGGDIVCAIGRIRAIEKVEGDWTETAAAGTATTLTGLAADTSYAVAVRAVHRRVATGGRGRRDGQGAHGARHPAAAAHGRARRGAARGWTGPRGWDATWTRVTWTDRNDVSHLIAEVPVPLPGGWRRLDGWRPARRRLPARRRP